MKKLFFVFLSFFIANISSAQTSAKKTGRLNLSNFKKSDFNPPTNFCNLSFARKKKIATKEAKKYILEVNSKVAKENITKMITIKNGIENLFEILFLIKIIE